MGHTLKRAGVAKGERNQPYYTTIGHWEAVIKLATWKSKTDFAGVIIRTGKDHWEAKDVTRLAKALASVTKKNFATYQKECRDAVLKNPITTCGHCEGEGVTIWDWNGQPQYPNFCVKCSGLGVIRDTYNQAEKVTPHDLERVIQFLTGTGEFAVGSGAINVS
jgi:hypothetical protein